MAWLRNPIVYGTPLSSVYNHLPFQVIVFNGWKKGETMKCARKTSKTILAVLLVGVVISVSSWAFAQGGAGNYTFLASKLGDDHIAAPEMIELSDITLNRTENISLDGKARLKEKPEQTTRTLSWETGAGKSYLIPALEIPAFLLLLNGYDRLAYPNSVEPDGKKTYNTNLSTFWDHVVHGPWGVDTDAFNVNQFMHPYQGSMYHGFARSAGLNYWESLLYTNAGSFLWETGGETTHPSINDQIASGIGGSFFGEALFRMASLVLEGEVMAANPGSGASWVQRCSHHPRGSTVLPLETGSSPCSRAIIRPPSGACGLAQI